MTVALVTLAVVCLAELGMIAWLSQAWGRERAGLLQRIQAPHMATLEHHERDHGPGDPGYAPPALMPDDDEAYWESRDQLAARVMSEEVAEQNGRDR